MILGILFSPFPVCKKKKNVCETLKPGRTEILMECCGVASKKLMRHEKKIKPQTVIVIVCGFEVSMHVLTFFLIRQYTIIINLSEPNQEFAAGFIGLA